MDIKLDFLFCERRKWAKLFEKGLPRRNLNFVKKNEQSIGKKLHNEELHNF
jgi:hypothetical protein